MKYATSAMTAHLQSDCTTLCTLFLCTRTDGYTVALTDLDRNVTYTSTVGSKANVPVTYEANDGMTRTAVATNSDLSPDNLDVDAFLDSESINETDIRGKLYDGATIEVRTVNYADLTMGEIKIRTGIIGKITMKNGLYTAELRGLQQLLSNVIGAVYGPGCRAELFDDKCKMSEGQYLQNGSVETAISAVSLTPASGLLMVGSDTPGNPAPAGWFNDGILTFTSGVNSGLSVQVKTWDGTTLVFTLPMFAAPQGASGSLEGDTFTITPGCNHSADAATGDCQNKFKNIVNFRGEPDIPGQDQVLAYAIPD